MAPVAVAASWKCDEPPVLAISFESIMTSVHMSERVDFCRTSGQERQSDGCEK